MATQVSAGHSPTRVRSIVGGALVTLAALIAVGVAVTLIALAGSSGAGHARHGWVVSAGAASVNDHPAIHGALPPETGQVLNPETGQMHGGFVQPHLTATGADSRPTAADEPRPQAIHPHAVTR